jgi:fatty acid amide hydrolase 2
MRPLLECSALELAGAIRRGEVTATEVVAAHIERHRQTAPWLRAIAADRFVAAERESAAADARVASTNATTTAQRPGPGELPPLLGVPFTVKESIALQGMPHSAGLVSRQGFRADESAPAVQALIEAGAIPLGVTNTSELTLWIESSNRVYGRTSNPYDRRRTAGGSSGGEGAAVGSGGSVFGVGSDIAGSIRIPAFFCGAFGHKPSPGVVSNQGLYPPAPDGQAARMLQNGPLARRAEDLMPLLRTMASAQARLGDPSTVSVEGMSVTTLENTSLLPISRELRDARERAVGALAGVGAVIRRVELRSWRRATLPFLATLQAGSPLTTSGLIEAEGEPPATMRSLMRRRGPHTAATRLALAAERLPQARGAALGRQLRAGRALADELTEAIGDGVLLHPPHPRVAPRHGTTIGRLWLLTPAAMFNLAGVPVTEVPLGLSAVGLPLGVQVAAGRDRDHVAIAVALELERVFGGWTPPWAM